jgi:hypothetical protein
MLFANARLATDMERVRTITGAGGERLIDNSITTLRDSAQQNTRPAVHLMLDRVAPYQT